MKTLATLYVVVLLSTISFYANAERPTVSQQQVISLINAPKATSYTLLDVRSAEEFADGHIKSATNISHKTLADKLGLLPKDKDQFMVVYCRSGRRAGVAEQILREAGYTNVWHLDGDMKGWLASELAVEK